MVRELIRGMISKYSLTGFKQLRDIRVDCKELNIFIGPNGAGKSTLLQSIDFLKAFVMSSVQMYLETRNIEFRDLFSARSRNGRTVRRARISWDVIFQLPEDHLSDTAVEYRYEVGINSKRVIQEKIWLIERSKEYRILERDDRKFKVYRLDEGEVREGEFLNPSSGFLATITEKDAETYPHLVRIKHFIENIQTFLIWDPAVLRTRSRGGHDEIGPNGQNLATALHELKRREPDLFRKMLGRLRKVIPSLQDIAIHGRGYGWKEIALVEKNNDGAVSFNHRQISDGTLRLIAIALIRYGLKRRTVVSFEEPENGVHPPILKETVRMIEEMTQLKPKRRTQVFVSTHNPYLLDLFQARPETIFVVEKGTGDTGAVITNLTADNVRAAALLFNHSIGDMWFSNFLSRGTSESDADGTVRGGEKE